jgi:mRNA-degrading endonuclease toxin of MazEF toxin-antitoxin module
VQSDLFNGTHSSVVVCLITSHAEDAPWFRIPAPGGGIAIPREKITRRAGALSTGALKQVDQALRLWLELA